MDLSQIGMLRKRCLEAGRGHDMPSTSEAAPSAGPRWRKVAVLILAIAVLGLPINDLPAYGLLLIATVIIFVGEVNARTRAWLAAAAIVVVAVAAQWLIVPPRIDEGHNVFLPGPADGALQRGLPADVYRYMADEFDAVYPPSLRCQPGSSGCWQGTAPERTFAFSADSIFHPSDLSRSAPRIDFSDPLWLRLGFTNELQYNWYTKPPDVNRAVRDGRFWMGLERWRLMMPWFEMIRLPPAFIGSELCWQGETLWERADGHFEPLQGGRCQAIVAADTGRRIFGIAIKPGTLAMHLTPPWHVWLLQAARGGIALAALCGLIVILVRVAPRRLILPFLLIGLALLVIAIDDASTIGRLRPFEGGNDGLFYDGMGRTILQNTLSGDISAALEGGEKVYYYGGPGLRYFRAIEHVIFGESYLGYLSLLLLLPFLTFQLARRYLPERWALGLVLVFTAIPIGEVFGTTFADYAKWATIGFADPATYIFFIAALLPLLGPGRDGPNGNFLPAFFGALLLALAVFTKPVILPAAGIMLAGTGLAALVTRQWRRVAGLCVGFTPILSMALHNWVYGHVFVPLSDNAGPKGAVLMMPPAAYLSALRELITLHFEGGYAARAAMQILYWLYGPAESFATVPINAAAVAILLYVVFFGRGINPWLRLIGVAALVQHPVALFYAPSGRYYFLTWFLTMLVTVVWMHDIGIGWLQRRYPQFCARFASADFSMRLASGLTRLQKVSS
jgi:hypothetical protein